MGHQDDLEISQVLGEQAGQRPAMAGVIGGDDVIEDEESGAGVELLDCSKPEGERERMDLGIAEVAARLHARAVRGEVDQQQKPLLVSLVLRRQLQADRPCLLALNEAVEGIHGFIEGVEQGLDGGSDLRGDHRRLGVEFGRKRRQFGPSPPRECPLGLQVEQGRDERPGLAVGGVALLRRNRCNIVGQAKAEGSQRFTQDSEFFSAGFRTFPELAEICRQQFA